VLALGAGVFAGVISLVVATIAVAAAWRRVAEAAEPPQRPARVAAQARLDRRTPVPQLGTPSSPVGST